MRAYIYARGSKRVKLATNLVGKAQQAYAALGPEDAGSYKAVKEAILRRYDITEESYRQRFRLQKRNSGESYRDLVAKLDDLACKWLQPRETLEEIRDKVVLEQLVNSLQEEVRVFVKERKPKSVEEAGILADDFTQARKMELGGERRGERIVGKTGERNSRNCYNCGKVGHIAKDCRVRAQRGDDAGRKTQRGDDAG